MSLGLGESGQGRLVQGPTTIRLASNEVEQIVQYSSASHYFSMHGPASPRLVDAQGDQLRANLGDGGRCLRGVV